MRRYGDQHIGWKVPDHDKLSDRCASLAKRIDMTAHGFKVDRLFSQDNEPTDHQADKDK